MNNVGQEVRDTTAAFVDNGKMMEAVLVEVDSVPMLNTSNPISNKRAENRAIPTTQLDHKQTVVADIWTKEQINFLNQVEKVLVFKVIITDIGSRKLELDHQMSHTDIEAFIKILLDPDSYPEAALMKLKKSKEFEPSYQMLLEAGNEKLTLMLDPNELEMVVATLFDRKNYKITSALIDFVVKSSMKK